MIFAIPPEPLLWFIPIEPPLLARTCLEGVISLAPFNTNIHFNHQHARFLHQIERAQRGELPPFDFGEQAGEGEEARGGMLTEGTAGSSPLRYACSLL